MLFILFGSLLGTVSNNPNNAIFRPNSLPIVISTIANYLYICLIIIVSIYGFIKLLLTRSIYLPHLLLSTSYLIILIWSVVTKADIFRYFVLFISILLCPIGLSHLIKKIHLSTLSKSTNLLLLSLLLLSFIYSMLNISYNPRVSGIFNNPNLFGLWIVASLVVFLIFHKGINPLLTWIYVLIAAILVILTGSRLAFLLSIIILYPLMLKHRKYIFLISLTLIPIFIIQGVNLEFRALEVDSAISDSGRSLIWEIALSCINSEPLIGLGMLGHIDCTGFGNVHNSFLRIAIMIGLPLTIIFYILYFLAVFKFYKSSNNIYIGFYFLMLPFSLFGEDYIVGFATPYFAFLVLLVALYINDQDRIRPSQGV